MQTKIFKMGKRDFIRQMIRLYGAPYIITISITLILCGLMSYIHDLRWIIAGMMVVFLAFPMSLAFFYIYHGFRPTTVINTLPHKLCFNSQGIETILFCKEESTDTGESVFKEISRKMLPYSQMGKYLCGLTSLTIPCHGDNPGFLWLPISAFENDVAAAEATRILSQGIHDSSMKQ